MLNFTAYLQSLTGLSWDKTGLTLNTAQATLRPSEAYGLVQNNSSLKINIKNRTIKKFLPK